MRILHTADWHLGARLIERDRLAEHAAFVDWLIETLRTEKIDALLLSGDVFDAANPPQDAVALYFDFLKRLADLKTVKAIITGGNGGIGLGMARGLARAGASIVIAGRNKDKSEDAVRDIEAPSVQQCLRGQRRDRVPLGRQLRRRSSSAVTPTAAI